MIYELNCAWCGNLFTTKKSNARCCKHWCSTRYSASKKNYYEIKKQKQALNILTVWTLEKNEKVYLDIEKFIEKIKRSNFMCDDIDILRLIDFYDILYPKKLNIPPYEEGDIESSYQKMFYKIFSWWRGVKKEKEKLWNEKKK